MKTHSIPGLIVVAMSISVLSAAPIVDGVRSESETYTVLSNQTVASGWGAGNYLGNIHHAVSDNFLHFHLAGRADGNAILFFIDSKPRGVNRITPGLIGSGGEEMAINNLAQSAETGLTFEAGFEPDYAIRIYGTGQEAFVNHYNLGTGVRTFLGQAHQNTVSGNTVATLQALWIDVDPDFPAEPGILERYAAADSGVEMSLNMSLLGVPEGPGQPIRVMALLVNGDSTLGSNQTLGGRQTAENIGGQLNSIDFNNEGGVQTLSFTVTGPVAALDPGGDEDADGLLNAVETDTGIFVDENDTGTSPFLADTDGDGISDFHEVNGSAPPLGLGFVSNPNIPNYAAMSVPGSFNQPDAWNPGGNSPTTQMAMAGTSLTEQYQWSLDYNFRQTAAIQYKFAANGSFDVNWGAGPIGGQALRNGGDLQAVVNATGFHTFAFDQVALTHTFQRREFPDYASFASAYNLVGGPEADDDSDGLTNAEEFAANTDPTISDTDGDGVLDGDDPTPLAATRDLVFSVDMSNVPASTFSPGTNLVRVIGAFDGPWNETGGVALTASGNGIYTGTLANHLGAPGTPFGPYKFVIDGPPTIYEEGFDRDFALGAANTPQILETVFFSNQGPSASAFDAWIQQFEATIPEGQGGREDDPDGDSFTNAEEYLFGTRPDQATGSLTETFGSAAGVTLVWNERPGVTYTLQESTTLAEDPWPTSGILPIDSPDQSAAPAGYTRRQATLATGDDKRFIRVRAQE